MNTEVVTLTVPSYYRENTASRPISEVKPGQAFLVLWWETTRESEVRYGFLLPFFFFLVVVFIVLGLLRGAILPLSTLSSFSTPLPLFLLFWKSIRTISFNFGRILPMGGLAFTS